MRISDWSSDVCSSDLQLVDDRVVADVDAVALGDLARLLVGADVEADDERLGRSGQGHVGLVDAAHAGVQQANPNLVGPELLQCGDDRLLRALHVRLRSEEHTSELQSLMRISYAVFCLKKKKH